MDHKDVDFEYSFSDCVTKVRVTYSFITRTKFFLVSIVTNSCTYLLKNTLKSYKIPSPRHVSHHTELHPQGAITRSWLKYLQVHGASPYSRYCGCIGEPVCVRCLLCGRGLQSSPLPHACPNIQDARCLKVNLLQRLDNAVEHKPSSARQETNHVVHHHLLHYHQDMCLTNNIFLSLLHSRFRHEALIRKLGTALSCLLIS